MKKNTNRLPCSPDAGPQGRNPGEQCMPDPGFRPCGPASGLRGSIIFMYGSILAVFLLALSAASQADISTDGTMGPATNLTGPDYAITQDLGTRTGNNLFHSFQRFSIHSGESGTFSGDAGINNVIGRVTGGEISNIDGVLRSTIPNADIYLINPSGIMVGQNASIDINGSLHISTADYLKLGINGRFDASNPGNTVLSVAAPSAFGFLGAPAGISFDRSNLRTPNGATLTVVGGDIDMQDATLHSRGGQIHLASVASAGEAVITPEGLDTSGFATLGNIEIRHTGNYFQRRVANLHTSSSDSGGVISIQAGQFTMDNGYIFADNTNGPGGQVDIQVTGDVIMKNEALATADTFGTGTTGTVEVTAANVILEDGGRFQVDNYGPGDGGTLTVNTSGTVSMAGKSVNELPFQGDTRAGLYAGSFGAGTGGTITVNADTVDIGADGKIEVNASFRDGTAGTLNLNADSLQMHDGGLVQTDTFGAGAAGTVNINVATAELTGGSSIAATTRGTGSGGTVNVTATDSVTISGSNDLGPSGIFTNSFNAGNGGTVQVTTDNLTMTDGSAIQSAVSGVDATAATTAGNIQVDAGNVSISGQSQISTQTGNAGQAGNITVAATDRLDISSPDDAIQSGIFSTTTGTGNGGTITVVAGALEMDGGAINASSNSAGNAGTITAQLGSLDLRNGAQLSTSVAGAGDGGNLDVVASDNAGINGQSASDFSSGLYSTAAGSGDGGNINLAANNVNLSSQGLITAESTGSGDAGNITIIGGDSVNLDNGFIRTRAVTSDGGNITIQTPKLLYLLDSEITTSVESGFGDGGNINIDPEFVVLDSSKIVANAFGGDGGNILIVTNNFIASLDSIVDASSQFGLDGTVIIKSPDSEVVTGITELPEDYLNVAALLREPCSARRSVNQSSFIVRGRSAIPPGPMLQLPSYYHGSGGGSVDSGAAPKVTTAGNTVEGVTVAGLSGAAFLAGGLVECGM